VFALVLARRDGKLAPGLVRTGVDCEAITAARRRQGNDAPEREAIANDFRVINTDVDSTQQSCTCWSPSWRDLA